MNGLSIVIGLVSGVASALLTLAVTAGSTLALLLFLFVPLPIMIAAMAWHHVAGLIGVLSASGILALLAGWAAARGFALSAGLPAWWLAYLALLGRPADAAGAPATPPSGGAPAMEWYPIGRLVLWAALLGAALVLATAPLVGGSLDGYRAVLRRTLDAFMTQEFGAGGTLPGAPERGRLLDVLVLAFPPLAASTWALVMLFNLWVGARVAASSGRLRRPWPVLSDLSFPRAAPFALCLALAVGVLPGLTGFAGGLAAATLLTAFALLGLAVIHAGTRGVAGRRFILVGLYLLLMVQSWAAILLAMLGLVEHGLSLRARLARGSPPAPPPD